MIVEKSTEVVTLESNSAVSLDLLLFNKKIKMGKEASVANSI